ncbi:MAG: hypothetical protein HKL85_13430 [Acidimicrobiaceae bacterium]|nr:hypothetical protein [Acidimicrobiaceae bacterium]
MSRWIAEWWKWKFELVIEDRDEIDGSYHDYPLDHPDEARSIEWIARRDRWIEEYREQSGGAPVCAVCGDEWTLAGDLHHRTYMHLGDERVSELVPLCRAHHVKVHEALERESSYLRMGRQYATDALIARLRAEMTNEVALLPAESEDQ